MLAPPEKPATYRRGVNPERGRDAKDDLLEVADVVHAAVEDGMSVPVEGVLFSFLGRALRGDHDIAELLRVGFKRVLVEHLLRAPTAAVEGRHQGQGFGGTARHVHEEEAGETSVRKHIFRSAPRRRDDGEGIPFPEAILALLRSSSNNRHENLHC